ncbi:hypothetical protein [Allosphingosinicella deserti]|uniref:hypothetical protein n=1 Tax=Allosphingosinicella deserti TaxID=2116704 RepID=UPI000D0ABA96|nr:hypothetical protein [Sphingomonas deserti]
MNEFVWYSDAMPHPSNMRPLRTDVSADDVDRVIAASARIRNGVPLDPDDVPRQVFGGISAKDHTYRPPHLFKAGGCWFVSGAAAAVLRDFDLGGGRLQRIEFLQKDRATPVEGDYFCIDFGNAKQALLPAQSKNIEPGGQGRYIFSKILHEGDLVVSRAALAGPDIWIDTLMWDALFLSGPLGTALGRAKVTKGFFLMKCPVAD